MSDPVSVASLVVAAVAVLVAVVGWRDDRRKLHALEEEVASLREMSKVFAERLKISQSDLLAHWVQVGIQGVDFLTRIFEK